MPIYEFTCEPCDVSFDELVTAGESVKCPKCGSNAVKAFTCTTNFLIPEYLKSYNDGARARYKAWANSDSVRKKLDSGVYTTGSEASGSRNRWDCSDHEE